MTRWWRRLCSALVLGGVVSVVVPLVAQCPAHRTMPLAEKLLHDARVCSKATQTDALCPVNQEPEMPTAYAMFKDCASTKPDGYLVVPTEPVTGTEDATLRTETYAKLWADAWVWALRFPKADAAWTALAANSQCARGIDQLHIHVSCVSDAVKKRLEAEREAIPVYKDATSFKEVELPLVDVGEGAGAAKYRVARVAALGEVTAVADAISTRARGQVCERKKSQPMSKQDVAVIGSSVAGEYFVLTYESGYGSGGAEDLLDQTCRQAEAAGGRQ
ncbi:MAG TPA: CDP-diacylglycerol diphosphatase [Edaphobacter sp.]